MHVYEKKQLGIQTLTLARNLIKNFWYPKVFCVDIHETITPPPFVTTKISTKAACAVHYEW